MKLSLNKTENHMVYFIVETEMIDVDVYKEMMYQRFIANRKKPKSNNSNVSEDEFEKNIIRDTVLDLAIKDIAQKSYSLAVEKYKINTEMQPIIRTIQKDPLIFEMVIPLKPVVNLCDYHTIRIEPESFDIEDEEVNSVLEGLRKKHCKFSPVDRPIKTGDRVTIDIKGEIGGVSLINRTGIRYDVNPEYSNELPEIYKELIGLSKGEEKEFKLIFPKNYSQYEVAGKEASYKINVREIWEVMLPDINDDLAIIIAPGVKSLDALRDRIKKNMIMERKSNSEDRYINRIMDKIIKESEINYPAVMMDLQINNLVEQYKQELCASCQNDIEYQNKLKHTNVDVLKKMALPLAEKRILWSLVIDEVAKKESIIINDDEIEGIISQIKEDQKAEQKKYLNNYQNRQDLYDIVKARKTIERLMEIVKRNELPLTSRSC